MIREKGQPMPLALNLPGMHHLKGAIDCHVHAAPHLTARSVDVFQAVRQAAAAGMRAIGLMDNFANSAGYAALAMRELGHLGVEVFGGLIMQPAAGGICADTVRTALGYGYGPGTGARFVSLPTHHTRHVAAAEGRSAAFLQRTFFVPASGPVPDPVPEIMELCAAHDVVFDCGHVSGREAIQLVDEARRRGCTRLRVHGNDYNPEEIAALAAAGAFVEFSFFPLSPAAEIALAHADSEKHRMRRCTVEDLALRIRAAGDRALLSSDAGLYLLPPPEIGRAHV